MVVADLQETAALKAFIKEAGSGKVKVLFQKTDVSKFADLEALVKRAKEELGAIDVMCNGAGVFEPVSLCPLLPKKERGDRVN